MNVRPNLLIACGSPSPIFDFFCIIILHHHPSTHRLLIHGYIPFKRRYNSFHQSTKVFNRQAHNHCAFNQLFICWWTPFQFNIIFSLNSEVLPTLIAAPFRLFHSSISMLLRISVKGHFFFFFRQGLGVSPFSSIIMMVQPL